VPISRSCFFAQVVKPGDVRETEGLPEVGNGSMWDDCCGAHVGRHVDGVSRHVYDG
jgi:hypothetical protein